MVLGRKSTGRAAADGASEQQELAYVEEEEETVEAGDVVMTESETATMAATEPSVGALTTADQSYPAQLRKVIWVYHCGDADGSRTKDGHCVLTIATERKMRYSDQPFGIGNTKKKQALEGHWEKERHGG